MANNDLNEHDTLQELIDEAKRIEEDSLYSAKGHFEAARSWNGWHLIMGIPTTLLAAAAGVTMLSDERLSHALQMDVAVVAGIVSLLVAMTSALFTFVNPQENATLHQNAGNAYKALHNDARIFHRVDCKPARPIDELASELKSLNMRRNTLNAESPQPPRRAFESGRAGIEAGEAAYQVDKPKRGSKK